MYFDEQKVIDGIAIDIDGEILYGSDQMNIDGPIRFATVNFELVDTDILNTIADSIRKERGYEPFYEDDGYFDGWYDFYIGIWDDGEQIRLDNSISFTVVDGGLYSEIDDNECEYDIELNDKEQNMILEELRKECKRKYDQTLEELMEESRKELEYEGN